MEMESFEVVNYVNDRILAEEVLTNQAIDMFLFHTNANQIDQILSQSP